MHLTEGHAINAIEAVSSQFLKRCASSISAKGVSVINAKESKQTVKNFFQFISEGKIDEAFSLVSNDVQWWVPEELPFSGTKSKAQYLKIVQQIQSGFPKGFNLTVMNMLCEDDMVSAEVESQGLHVNGKTYQNKYHFLITLKDGQFIAVKEYMNTLHLAKLINAV
jgi:uncharacterized protein